MPRRLTRPEVARRLAIRAAMDAGAGLSTGDLARLFAASKRTVRDAAHHDVAGWLAVLVAAPVPRQASPPGRPGQRPPRPAVTRRPPSRAGAVLVPPEPEPEIDELPADVDLPEPAWVDEQDTAVDVPEPADPRDPLDDPIPRKRRGAP